MTNSVHIPFIDGLRAIAVVWVLAFHYFGTLFPGGFVGVDIFFVISGYLISGIIWRELDEKRFSFGHFYSRRIRRIFPALLTVLLFTLGVGLVLLHEQELRQLAKHAFAAALFLNNWALSVEKGYFDVDSEDKPLLHLWSLSIEEQFYLLWPLLLWWLARLERPQKMQRIVLGLTLASFAACALQTFTHPVGAYYSPHTRIWELLAGALLHFVPTQRRWLPRHAASVGLVILVACLWLIAPTRAFPGFWALLPVLATLAILLAPPDDPVRAWLGRRPLVFIGQISYPLYLWHWPLLSLGTLFYGASLSPLQRLGLLAASLCLAWWTSLWIERPLRYGGAARLKVSLLVGVMVLQAWGALWIYRQHGWPQREFLQRNIPLGSGDLPPSQATIERKCPSTPAGFECWRNLAPTLHGVVMGDSKGKALFEGLMRATNGREGWIYLGGNARDGAPVPRAGGTSLLHQAAFAQALKTLETLPEAKTVVVAVALRTIYGLSRDDSLHELEAFDAAQLAQVQTEFTEGLRQLLRPDRRVWILVDNPTFPHPPRCLGRQTGWAALDALKAPPPADCSISLETHLARTRVYRELLDHAQRTLDPQGRQLRIFDSTPLLCSGTRCDMTRDGVYLYDFTDHVSAYGGRWVARGLLEAMRSSP